ncbi:uncharacterized protein LOC119416386 [Nematolebias whitei]|uniref:uncharacterized protein LOC119416386 n=1 Tax=Nematolebias whitei TaxID=451745 RepID=UPI0018991498|nr:uncharacterized protein LOC119416386 [Nematolebias whitei]
MVHNHTVWENIYDDLVARCPSVRHFGEWTKCKERMDYLRRRYRDCLKQNQNTCPYYEELDAVLGCRPMNNPGEIKMDNGGSDDEEFDCGSSETTRIQNTSGETDAPDVDLSSSSSSSTSPPLQTPKPKPQEHRRRKERKTRVMKAINKSLDRLLAHANSRDYDRERFEWEKEKERNRMELEKKRLDFEMKKMEADEKRAEENRALMLQLVQCIRPPPQHLPYAAPSSYYPFTPPHRQPPESMEFPSSAPGPPPPAAHQVHFDPPQ